MKKILLSIKTFLGLLRRKLLHYYVWPYVFKKSSRNPVDEKKALLVSGGFSKLPDNLAALKPELEARGLNCIELLAPETGCRLAGRFSEFRRNIDFQKEYATAAYVFLEDLFLPVYANQPRPETRVVQLWHACGAFKKWGYSTAELDWGADRKSLEAFPLHNTYTDVCVSSQTVAPYYAEAFNCSQDIIHPIGVPRTDVYFDSDFVQSCRAQLLKLFPGIGERKVILYAPTFRGNSVIKSYMDLKLDLDAMARELSEDYVLVYKLHPQTAKGFVLSESERERLGDFVFDVSSRMRADEALCAADILVSDYSSVIFEFSLLSRPMLFFAYDLEQYDKSRSFYIKYEDFVPGPIVRDTQEIIREIKRLDGGFDPCAVERLRSGFMSACDGASARRIAEFFTS